MTFDGTRLHSLALALAAALAFACGSPAQAPAPATEPPKAEPTTAAAKPLPEVGEPATPPDGAPEGLALVERKGLQAHAYWLADDARGGRFTGSAGQQETAKYVADRFQALGLRPIGDKKTFFQHYPVARTALDPSTSLQFGTTKVTAGFAVLPSSDADKVSLSGRLVWCGGGRATEIPGGLAGTIPVASFEKPPRGQGPAADLGAVQRFKDFARQCAGSGATACVVCLPLPDSVFGNTLSYHGLLPDHALQKFGSESFSPIAQIPVFVLAADPSTMLFRHLGLARDGDGLPTGKPEKEKATAKLAILTKKNAKGTASNVVAVVDGKGRKAEAIVVSAHHDHIGTRLDGDAFNGADDNASGTAGLLELAEAFAKGPKPDRSVVFLSVSGEELGLWGSAWFAEHPTWPLDKIVANVNVDMIGRAAADGDKTRIQVTPSREHAKYSTLVREAVRLGGLLGITFESGDQYFHRSDHYNFAKKGVPVVFFCDGEHPDYHQVTDHADKLDYARMESVARLAYWTAWQAAHDKGRPKELGAQPDW